MTLTSGPGLDQDGGMLESRSLAALVFGSSLLATSSAQTTLLAGDIDLLNPGGPSAAPSPALAGLVDAIDFDVLPGCGAVNPINKTVAHTFTGIPDRLLSARLRIRVRAGCAGAVGTDGIGLLFADAQSTDYCSEVAWGAYFGPVDAPDSLCLSTGDDPGILASWTFEDQLLWTLDLAALPTPNGTVSLLGELEQRGFLDVTVGDETGVDFFELTYEQGIGATDCTNAVPNSTGMPGQIEAFGRTAVSENNVTLRAFDMSLVSSGYFLASPNAGFAANPGGSTGNLCLGSPIGRYIGPGQVQNTALSGSFSLRIDVASMPQPMGTAVVLPGETWRFQAWHRDHGAAGATSNFTTSMAITFD